jgi:F1F0 ATPase subunit 2
MRDTVMMFLAFVAGICLGAVFFGGLWWTVRRGLVAKQPALWLLGSALLRTAFVLAGFYLIGRSDWRRLLVALAGFILVRPVVIWATRPSEEHVNAPGKSHAS